MYAQHEHKIMSAAHAGPVGLIPLTTYRIQFINKKDNYHAQKQTTRQEIRQRIYGQG